MLERDGPRLPISTRLPSVTDIVSSTLRAGVSYRQHGMYGELRKRIVHRFPAFKLKCESSMGSVLAESVTQSNALLRALQRKGK